MAKRKGGESPEHKLIKGKIYDAFKSWYGCTLKEFNEAGHRLDVFSITNKGLRILVEIIWNDSEVHYLKDIALVHRNDCEVKIVIGSEGVINKFTEDYSKTVASQLNSGVSINTTIIPANKLLNDNDYFLNEFKKVVDELITIASNKKPSLFSISARMLDLVKVKTNIRIAREELFLKLREYMEINSGLIIGSPGIGKTFCVKCLCEYFMKNNIPIFFVPIDRVNAESDIELISNLNIPYNNIIDFLNIQFELYNKKGIIVFDSFDSARSEKAHEYYLNLIQEIKDQLKDKYNILVSVRIFDAKKSQRLMQIFKDEKILNTDNSYRIPGIKINHFAIKELSEDEVKCTVKKRFFTLYNIYNDLSIEFKSLLRTPFNLWLVEKIYEDKEIQCVFTKINSKIDLLEQYWLNRVENGILSEQKKAILIKLTSDMIQNKKLISKLSLELLSNANNAWLNLLSSEVITYSEAQSNYISYSHNILFDYAVSKLLMDENAVQFTDFISSDLSRPLFLRPSMDFYFSRIWHKKREYFWEIFWFLLKEEKISIRIFARIIPTGIIVQEAKNSDEITPILDKQPKADLSNQAILRLLQAFRAYECYYNTNWLNFFKKLSYKPSIIFAWDLSMICLNMLEKVKDQNQNEQLIKLGIIFRNLLSWALEERYLKDQNLFDQLISYKLIEGVSKTYYTSIVESKILTLKILKVIEEKNFDIYFFYSLTRYIEFIAQYDNDIVYKIYLIIFNHSEESIESTNMGSPILPMRSNRKQDFSSCKYNLIDYFSKYLKSHPVEATMVMIGILNNHIIKVEAFRFSDEDPIIEKIIINGKENIFIPDMCYYWDQDYKYHYDSIYLISKAFFDFLIDLSNTKNIILINQLVNILKNEIKVSYLWRHLFNVGKLFPTIFKEMLFELCKIKLFYIHNETSYEIGEFLSAISKLLFKEELCELEDTILGITSERSSKFDMEHLLLNRNKMLMCIPVDLLQRKESIDIIDELNKKEVKIYNTPIFKMGHVETRPYTDSDYFKAKGVDINKPDNENIINLYNSVKNIITDIQNKIVTDDNYSLIFKESKELYDGLNKYIKADNEVKNSANSILAESIVHIGFNIDNPYIEEFNYCRKIAIQCSKHELPKVTDKDKKYDFPAWEPSPRNEISRVLPYLCQLKEDDELISSLKNLIFDPSPQVRMLITRELFRLEKSKLIDIWQIMLKICEVEDSVVILESLIISINYLLFSNIEKSVEVLTKLKEKALGATEHKNIQHIDHDYLVLVSRLLILKDNIWSKNVFYEIINNPKELSKALHTLSLILDEFIKPNVEDDLKQKVLPYIKELINSSSKELKLIMEYKNEELDEQTINNFKNIYGVIDNLISRFYFNADIRENNNSRVIKLTEEVRIKYYFFIKPILMEILNVVTNQNKYFLQAPSAHYFMQLLNGMLRYDPRDILIMASKVVQASKPYGYNLDDLATKEIVILVEAILADYKNEIQDNEAIESLLNLLDIFAETGWPTALKLIWRLDEIYR